MTPTPRPAAAQLIRPPGGRLRRAILNLALRLFVKWPQGARIDVARLRRRQAQLDRRLGRLPATAHRESSEGIAAQWIGASDAAPGRVILYLHGGAFIARSPAAHAAMVHPWCEALRARALMVDYRLAPEHPFPAALDDCEAAYRWLLQRGHTASDIVLAGDSAGGNLALALMHRLRASGTPLPACAVLLSPFVDFTLSSPSLCGNAARDPVFTLAFAMAIRALYAAPEHYLDPRVSPLFGDFHGLPPMLIQVGSTEMLLDDARRLAEKASAAGVPVQLEIWERMAHVFQVLGSLPQARAARRRIVEFIGARSGWSGNPGSSVEMNHYSAACLEVT